MSFSPSSRLLRSPRLSLNFESMLYFFDCSIGLVFVRPSLTSCVVLARCMFLLRLGVAYWARHLRCVSATAYTSFLHLVERRVLVCHDICAMTTHLIWSVICEVEIRACLVSSTLPRMSSVTRGPSACASSKLCTLMCSVKITKLLEVLQVSAIDLRRSSSFGGNKVFLHSWVQDWHDGKLWETHGQWCVHACFKTWA